MSDIEGRLIPADFFVVDVPKTQQPLVEQLMRAVSLAGELYAQQYESLKPLAQALRDDADIGDPLAHHPLTVPQRGGKFVYLWQDQDAKPSLAELGRVLKGAALASEDIHKMRLAVYLNDSAQALRTGNFDLVMERYIRLNSGSINYHAGPVERQFGKKRMWQGYLGLVDREGTVDLRNDLEALRLIGAGENEGVWFTPQTNASVDQVIGWSGYLSNWSYIQRQIDAGLPVEVDGVGLSAFNIPNEVGLTSRVGNKITIFSRPFLEVHKKIVKISRDFLSPDLIPSDTDCARFVMAHELAHDEKYPNDLGWWHSPHRESYANLLALRLCALAWLQSEPEKFSSVVKGALGYALLDTLPILRQQMKIDVEDITGHSSHGLGSLILLTNGIRQGSFEVDGGRVVAVNLDKTALMVQALRSEQRLLLSTGTPDQVRGHYEAILLPPIPLPLGAQYYPGVSTNNYP